MLRITIQESQDRVAILLEGRLTGEWVAELRRAWTESSRNLDERAVSLDLRDLLWTDAEGKGLLREIKGQTGAALIANNPWTRQLAAEICDQNPNE